MTVLRPLSRIALLVTILVSAAVGVLAADPGIPMPQLSENPHTNDQARGFMLIYNVYTSSSSNPATHNTRFSITNTNEFDGISVHLYFVDGGTCSISDRYVCLTPNQTTVFTAAEQDPGTTGYLLAVATASDGEPVPFDYLIGDAFVKFQTGYFGNLGAEAIPSHNVVGASPSPDGSLFLLAFVGLPRVLAVDSIGSRADGNETLLVVNGVGGFFTSTANTIGSLFGLLFNDQEEPHSWNRTGGCQLVTELNNSFPRTTPRFDDVIPAGQTGWMKFWSTTTINNLSGFGIGTAADGRALLGSVFQRNAGSGSSSGAFQGARNLHKLNVVSEFQLQTGLAERGPVASFTSVQQQQQSPQVTVFVFPVFPSTCGFINRRDVQ